MGQRADAGAAQKLPTRRKKVEVMLHADALRQERAALLAQDSEMVRGRVAGAACVPSNAGRPHYAGGGAAAASELPEIIGQAALQARRSTARCNFPSR